MQALDMVLSGMVVLKLTHLEVQRLLKVLLAKEVMEHTMQAAMVELEAEADILAEVQPDIQHQVLKAEAEAEAALVI